MTDYYSSFEPLLQDGSWRLGALKFQSGDIPPSEWANLFTLCLAPLIAHVFGGVPQPVYLSQKLPSWHEHIWQYNPTSILWRYFVITDRRIRAKAWSESEMAASNAYFWTGREWDGSLQMMERSRAFALRLPHHHRVRSFSASTLVTIIITIQGLLASRTLVDGIYGLWVFTINVGSIFYPLAVFGLLRLFAAMWLTDDYVYHGDFDTMEPCFLSDVPASKEDRSSGELKSPTSLSLLKSSDFFYPKRFHRIDSWRGIVFRTIYLAPLCGLVVICFIYFSPSKIRGGMTMTTFLMDVFHLSFLGTSTILYSFYFITGRSTNSIIPCASTLWYKIYSLIIMVLALAVITVACLETRKSPCGAYTTYPSNYFADQLLCSEGHLLLPNNTLYPYGIAAFQPVNSNGTIDSLAQDETVQGTIVTGFEGMCFGKFLGNVSDGDTVQPLNNTYTPTTSTVVGNT